MGDLETGRLEKLTIFLDLSSRYVVFVGIFKMSVPTCLASRVVQSVMILLRHFL